MKKLLINLLIIVSFVSCSIEDDCCVHLESAEVTIKFTHHWNGVPVTLSDFNDLKFTNQNGEQLSIERLRYLVSKIRLADANNQEIVLKTHQLINLEETTSLQFQTDNVSTGDYKLYFTFGFSDADNQDGIYPDLNTANFNVPGMLGGGYHFMQFDGKFLDTNNQESPFNYHAIRAVDTTDPSNLIFEDTSLAVDLAGNVSIINNTQIEIKMNIAEWFKNPNTWDLNQLNTILMPNFDAQKMIGQNAKTVFSLGEVIHN